MATTGTGQTSPNIENHHYHYHNYHRTSVANLTKLIGVELDLLKESFEEAKRRIDPVIAQVNQARHKFDLLLQQAGVGETMDMERELRDLKQTTGKLKSKIPFNLIAPEYQPAADPNVIFQPRTHLPKSTTLVYDEVVDDNPPIPQDLDLFFRDHHSYRSTVLRCLLAFPEGAFIKASLLWSYVNATLYDLLEDERHAHLENTVSVASDLVSEGFIKPVYKKHSSTTAYGFWMDPLVRHTLRDHLSKRADGPTYPTSFVTSTIDGEDIFYGDSADPSTWPSEQLRFLHLGKWQRSPTHHIEMPDPNLYFKYTGPLLRLTYISFRGVSVMKELPDFITHRGGLRVLDLKACHHLEVLPSNIGNLWYTLTHLDMSECYFVDHMPASLSMLFNLRVLKGFFVGETNNEEESCTLQDLSSFKDLTKLNIYTSLKTFPSENHLTILQGIKQLRNLTICWGGCPDENRELRKSPAIRPKRLVTHDPDPVVLFDKQFPFHLEKLDLRGAPEDGTGNWLMPWNFERLEKLYIRGGKLNDLRNTKEAQKGKRVAGLKQDGWSVKILRLRHLSKLRLDWSELQGSFPNVVTVEKVDCPNLTSFPCDDSGLWTANATQPPADTAV